MDSDDQDTSLPHTSPFEAIRKVADDGSEYWRARDLSRILAYDDYRNFVKVITKARLACEQSGQVLSDHFVEVNEMVDIGSSAKRKVPDVYLSRYVCYLIVQNADPSKPIVALGQTYFAVQTRRQGARATARVAPTLLRSKWRSPYWVGANPCGRPGILERVYQLGPVNVFEYESLAQTRMLPC